MSLFLHWDLPPLVVSGQQHFPFTMHALSCAITAQPHRLDPSLNNLLTFLLIWLWVFISYKTVTQYVTIAFSCLDSLAVIPEP